MAPVLNAGGRRPNKRTHFMTRRSDQSVPVTAPGITSPFGLLRFAEQYRVAAVVVHQAAHPDQFSNPAFMLIGQSIELSLKAFLLARGVTLEKLKFKPYGHDLERLLSEAILRRLDRLVTLHSFHQGAIKAVSPIYRDHEFRYIVTGTRTIPEWGFVSHAAAELTRCQHDWLLRRRIGKAAALNRIALRGRF